VAADLSGRGFLQRLPVTRLHNITSWFTNDAQITSIGILKRRTEFQQELPKDAGGRLLLMGVQIFGRKQKLHANTGIGMREAFV
jgi:hypothetical protein